MASDLSSSVDGVTLLPVGGVRGRISPKPCPEFGLLGEEVHELSLHRPVYCMPMEIEDLKTLQAWIDDPDKPRGQTRELHLREGGSVHLMRCTRNSKGIRMFRSLASAAAAMAADPETGWHSWP